MFRCWCKLIVVFWISQSFWLSPAFSAEFLSTTGDLECTWIHFTLASYHFIASHFLSYVHIFLLFSVYHSSLSLYLSLSLSFSLLYSLFTSTYSSNTSPVPMIQHTQRIFYKNQTIMYSKFLGKKRGARECVGRDAWRHIFGLEPGPCSKGYYTMGLILLLV